MTPQEWLDRLQPGEIPLFRRTHTLLAELSPRRDQVTAREVATDILADPLATFQAMHAINQRVGQRFGTEVASVEHALMMQGIGVYLDAARSLPVLEDTPAGKDEPALDALYALTRRAQHAAWQARDFAVLHSDVRAEEVQVAALLHYAPEYLLWLRAPEQARGLKRLARRMPWAEAEGQVFGMPLQALRLQMLEAWSIPPVILDLLDDKHPEWARQQILAACIAIARHSERGWWDEGLLEHYLALARVDNIPLETIIATAHMNAARVARAGQWLPVPAAATWAPMLPGTWPEELDEDEETAAAASSHEAAPEQATAAPQQPDLAAPPPIQAAVTPPPALPEPTEPTAKEDEPHTVCPMPDKHVFRETLNGIAGHLDGSLTLNQMSAIILKGLHTGLGLSRILFAMVTPDGRRVKSRFTLGIPPEDPLRQFEIDLGNKDLFAQLMGKMQGVWVSESNREKLWPMVSPSLQQAIGSGDFFAMSLYNGTQPVGLIYADRGHGECGLDPLSYTDFKMLCLQAARGLAKVK